MGDVLFFLIETLWCRSLVSCGVSSTLHAPSFCWFLVYLYFPRQGLALSPRLACGGVIPGSGDPPPSVTRAAGTWGTHQHAWLIFFSLLQGWGVSLCCPGVALFSGECTVGFYGAPLYLGRGCGILVRKWPSGFLPAQPGSRVVSPPGLVCVCWPVGLSPGLQTGAGPWSVRDRGVIAGGEWRAK